ncbi:MAG: hypothetical protein J5867_00330 [Prevotella sp.]|nr:hypothetical protein [Prevotella sp.]
MKKIDKTTFGKLSEIESPWTKKHSKKYGKSGCFGRRYGFNILFAAVIFADAAVILHKCGSYFAQNGHLSGVKMASEKWRKSYHVDCQPLTPIAIIVLFSTKNI